MNPIAPLNPDELVHFSELIFQLAGISISPKKSHLIESRLLPRLQATSCTTYKDYLNYLTALPREHTEWQTFINLLTTNKTDFFREIGHFEYLVETILPEWLKRDEETFRAWSCASSTGEEPYTLGMVLKHFLPPDRRFEILATDIDTNVLSTAQNGVYPIAKLDEIPEGYRRFTQEGKREAEGWFRIANEVRSHVSFRPYNLVETSLPDDSLFDLILCRNVMIYFTRETVATLVTKLFTAGKPKAHLFIGHSEAIQNLDQPWTPVRPAIFRKE